MTPPLHPLLRAIYFLIRLIAWLGISVFYRRRILVGRKNLPFDGPAIVVANHPSTLMDVLNPCVHIPQELFFLANYGLFKHPVSRWILTRLYCIPVKRREDVSEGELRNNDAAFEQSFQHLEKKGLLFIAAEGVSWMERWVRPFKPGAARIAFGAEKRHDWNLDVKIIPIGLSYSAPNLFRSEVVVHFGAPVYARDWKELENDNHETAVESFTEHLQQVVKALVLDTQNAEGQAFMEQLESVCKPEFPTMPEAYFDTRKQLIDQNIDNLPLKSAMAAYFTTLQTTPLQDAGVRSHLHPADGAQKLQEVTLLIVGLPFFLTGYLFWWLPCFLPGLLARRLKLYIGYDSNVKMLAGLFTFPLALWVAFRTASHFLPNGWWALGSIVALTLLGYFAEGYLEIAQRWRIHLKTRQWAKKHPEQMQELLELRAQMMANIKGLSDKN
jgi:glycerol-3-phosphate O-acyltransferase / dihydroxyacetone phosphate acyltransferase